MPAIYTPPLQVRRGTHSTLRKRLRNPQSRPSRVMPLAADAAYRESIASAIRHHDPATGKDIAKPLPLYITRGAIRQAAYAAITAIIAAILLSAHPHVWSFVLSLAS